MSLAKMFGCKQVTASFVPLSNSYIGFGSFTIDIKFDFSKTTLSLASRCQILHKVLHFWTN